jgi:hypothetical protein
MPHSLELNFIIEYFHEYEFIFETALDHEKEDPGVFYAEN